ncbi:hypothetical protein D9611_011269 [Ephemerocybe angulata]|uniref:Uncharacterized protein n=1 Tax=Ephemerocybe angulata TaxID=980116 RepID=A0A8H5F1R0_9AGAR|nr:hypothetical protein D9611_011269 [Tulosesus angulatus]
MQFIKFLTTVVALALANGLAVTAAPVPEAEVAAREANPQGGCAPRTPCW